jgi:hypothetical protein
VKETGQEEEVRYGKLFVCLSTTQFVGQKFHQQILRNSGGEKRKNLCANVREAQEENVLLFCIIFDAKSFDSFPYIESGCTVTNTASRN